MTDMFSTLWPVDGGASVFWPAEWWDRLSDERWQFGMEIPSLYVEHLLKNYLLPGWTQCVCCMICFSVVLKKLFFIFLRWSKTSPVVQEKWMDEMAALSNGGCFESLVFFCLTWILTDDIIEKLNSDLPSPCTQTSSSSWRREHDT